MNGDHSAPTTPIEMSQQLTPLAVTSPVSQDTRHTSLSYDLSDISDFGQVPNQQSQPTSVLSNGNQTSNVQNNMDYDEGLDFPSMDMSDFLARTMN